MGSRKVKDAMTASADMHAVLEGVVVRQWWVPLRRRMEGSEFAVLSRRGDDADPAESLLRRRC